MGAISVWVPGLEPVYKTSPWEHQRRAVEFALPREASYLALDMGTGKSKVTIDLAYNWAAQTILIIAPLRVCPAWAKQFDLHYDGQYAMAVLDRGTIKQRTKRAVETLAQARARKIPAVIVINYESFWREPFGPIHNARGRLIQKGFVLGVKWDLVVLDEAHKIKSPGGSASWCAKALASAAKHRLCLSGTPMPHSPLDIYAQMRFLDIDVFGGSSNRFRATYCTMGGWDNKQIVSWHDLDKLRARFYAHAYRVMAADVLDLPEAVHESLACTLSPGTMRIYDQLRKELVAQYEAGEITAANGAVKLLRLQQITGGSAALEGGGQHRIDEAKSELLAELLDSLDLGEPVVVFGRFRADLDRIAEVCEKAGRAYRELSGRTNELAEWQAGEGDILGVQIQAGGAGVDLTRAHYCIYYSLGFSLGDYEQSLARLHRPGQERTVYYYHLLAEKTVDEEVYKALREKRDVVAAVLDGINS